MHRDTCYQMCTCDHSCKIRRTSENSPVPTSLSTVQSHIPNRKFAAATAALVTVSFRFQNSHYPIWIKYSNTSILYSIKTLCIADRKHLGSLMQFQISKSSRSCRRGGRVRIEICAPISSRHGLLVLICGGSASGIEELVP